MKYHKELESYLSKQRDNNSSFPKNGEIIEYEGVKYVAAIGKKINGEFAYADLASAQDASSNVLYGGHKVACVELPDNLLPGLLITNSGKIYHTKTHWPYKGVVLSNETVISY